MLGVPRSRALDEDHARRELPVGRPSQLAAGEHGLELVGGDDVGGRPVPQVAELGGVVGPGPGGLDDGPGPEALHPRRGLDLDAELAGLALDGLDPRLGEDLDPRVLLDRGHEVGERARHQGVVGRAARDLVAQVLRAAPEGLVLLDQDHLVAEAGGPSGRLEPGYAAAHHQDPGLDGLGDRSRGLGPRHLRHAHQQQVLGEHLGVFFVGGVGPDHLLAQAHPLDHGSRPVEPQLLLLRPGGAGGEDHALELLLVHGLADGVHALGRAEARVAGGAGGPGLVGRGAQGLDVQGLADAATGAGEDADSLHHALPDARARAAAPVASRTQVATSAGRRATPATRAFGVVQAEAVVVALEPQGQDAVLEVGHHAGGEHHQVGLVLDEPAGLHVLGPELQSAALAGLDVADLALDQAHALLLGEAGEELLVPPEGAGGRCSRS